MLLSSVISFSKYHLGLAIHLNGLLLKCCSQPTNVSNRIQSSASIPVLPPPVGLGLSLTRFTCSRDLQQITARYPSRISHKRVGQSLSVYMDLSLLAAMLRMWICMRMRMRMRVRMLLRLRMRMADTADNLDRSPVAFTADVAL